MMSVDTVSGGYGGDAGEFDQPSGVTINNVGNVSVVDTHNSRVQKLAPARSSRR